MSMPQHIEDHPAPTTTPVPRPRSPLAWIVLGFIWLWRLTAPLRAPRCRFYPSCSTYAVEAVRRHGALRGGWYAIRRLGRCHPWNPGGVDHVPVRK
jgi:putative membrane protein insertion efficiency factor